MRSFSLFSHFLKTFYPIGLKFYVSFCYDNGLLNMLDGVSCMHDYGYLSIDYAELCVFWYFFPKVIFLTKNYWQTDKIGGINLTVKGNCILVLFRANLAWNDRRTSEILISLTASLWFCCFYSFGLTNDFKLSR